MEVKPELESFNYMSSKSRGERRERIDNKMSVKGVNGRKTQNR
jgi:hypothetical protein